MIDNKGMDTLQSWVASEGMTHRDAADLIGCSRSHFTMLMAGSAFPSRKLMKRIEQVSGGRVPIISWFEAIQ